MQPSIPCLPFFTYFTYSTSLTTLEEDSKTRHPVTQFISCSALSTTLPPVTHLHQSLTPRQPLYSALATHQRTTLLPPCVLPATRPDTLIPPNPVTNPCKHITSAMSVELSPTELGFKRMSYHYRRPYSQLAIPQLTYRLAIQAPSPTRSPRSCACPTLPMTLLPSRLRPLRLSSMFSSLRLAGHI